MKTRVGNSALTSEEVLRAIADGTTLRALARQKGLDTKQRSDREALQKAFAALFGKNTNKRWRRLSKNRPAPGNDSSAARHKRAAGKPVVITRRHGQPVPAYR